MSECIEITKRVKCAGDVHAELLKAGWDLEAATQFVNNIPDAADVVEVKHGRWVSFKSEHAGDIWYCSACDVGCTWRPNYCPNCGAKMLND